MFTYIRLLRIGLAASIILLALTANRQIIFSQDNTTESLGQVDLNGIVLDADMHPIEKALVVLMAGEETISSAETAENGSYVLPQVEYGDYLLIIQLPESTSDISQAYLEISVNDAYLNKQMVSIVGTTENPPKLSEKPSDEKKEKPVELDDAKKEADEQEELEFESSEQMIVTGTFVETANKNAPVKTHLCTRHTIEATKSETLADALNFVNGLRVENNCQNCNFTQLRMNGLDGHYSQILIDGMPLISSLAGIYGLEQIPEDMIERIEVIKGGSSAVYSGNAVAGVVNVITRIPDKNHFQLDSTTSILPHGTVDTRLGGLASVVSDDNKFGAVVFGTLNYRNPFFHDDKEDDEFSDIGKLNGLAFGTNLFFRPIADAKLTVGLSSIFENRRGGDMFSHPRHTAGIAESIRSILGMSNIKWEHVVSQNFNYFIYSGFSFTHRDSYYGAEQDPNAFGLTTNPLSITGAVFNFLFEGGGSHMITVGGDFTYDMLKDSAPLWDHTTKNKYWTIGSLVEWKYSPIKKLTLLAGMRLDKHSEIKPPIIVPRASILYHITDFLTLRTTFTSGYRPPRVFDEDMHITIVGGDRQIVTNDNDLKEERSWGGNVYLDYEDFLGKKENIGLRVSLGGFIHQINNAFVLDVVTPQPTPGELHFTRTNGEGARVAGGEIELGFLFSKYYEISFGLTMQKSMYLEKDTDFNSANLFRTPSIYGYFVSALNIKGFEFNLAGILTGRMYVPHYAGYIDENTLEHTKPFFELNALLGYNIALGKDKKKQNPILKIYGGVKNMLNSYQKDFDIGIDRDAGYVYGPRYPIHGIFGLQLQY